MTRALQQDAPQDAPVQNGLVFHRVYGITLACDEPLPGIDVCDAAGEQTRVHTRAMPHWLVGSLLARATQIYPAPGQDDASVSVRHIDAWSAYFFEYDDGVRFMITGNADDVWLDWPPSVTLDAAAMYLLGPIMTWVLRLRGTTCLHASVVAVKGQAVVIAGGEGAGKSTTAAALAKLGIPVLSDDLAAIENSGALHIRAGYSSLRLWPDSADALFTSDALSPLAHGWEKLGLDLHQNDFAFEPRTLPLGAVFLLAPRSAADDAPRIAELSPRDALLGLVANSAAGPLLDTRMRAEELALMGRIAREAPVKSIVPHDSHARLPELCQVLLRDARGLIA